MKEKKPNNIFILLEYVWSQVVFQSWTEHTLAIALSSVREEAKHPQIVMLLQSHAGGLYTGKWWLWRGKKRVFSLFFFICTSCAHICVN